MTDERYRSLMLGLWRRTLLWRNTDDGRSPLTEEAKARNEAHISALLTESSWIKP